MGCKYMYLANQKLKPKNVFKNNNKPKANKMTYFYEK